MGTSTVRTRSYGKSKRVIVAGSIETNGASPFDQAKLRGEGFSIVRTGSGTAEVTFDEIYASLESFTCSQQSNQQNADRAIMPGIHTAPASPTKGKIQILCFIPSTGAAGEFLGANADNRINFIAVLKLGAA